MTLLILGLVLWWAVHMFPIMAPTARRSVTDKIGLGPSKGIAALLLIGSVVLMVLGYKAADPAALWTPPAFLTHVNNFLMILSVVIFIAGTFKSPVRRAIRHPQLIGFKTWAVAHLLVNPDLGSIVLFGGLLAWAVVAVIFLNKRDGPRGELPEATGRGLALHLGASAVVFVAITFVHGVWLGVWPFPGSPPTPS